MLVIGLWGAPSRARKVGEDKRRVIGAMPTRGHRVGLHTKASSTLAEIDQEYET